MCAMNSRIFPCFVLIYIEENQTTHSEQGTRQPRHVPSPQCVQHEEEEEDQPPIPDDMLESLRSNDKLLKLNRKNWKTIKDSIKGKVRSVYNYRIKTSINDDTFNEIIEEVLRDQQHCFKINASYGFILRNVETGEFDTITQPTNLCGTHMGKHG